MELKQLNKQVYITWNKEWVGKYESPWSIFQKFKLANSASIEDLFFLYGDLETQGLNSWGKKYRNLLTLEGFDDNKIENLLGVPLKYCNTTYQKNLTEIFINNEPSIYFRENLNYCSLCMEIGYHSIFHQFKLLNYCPYHMTPLINKCLICNRIIPFHLSDVNVNISFTCDCEQTLFSYSSNNTSIWKQIKTFTIQDPLLQKWMLLNDKYPKQLFVQLGKNNTKLINVLKLIVDKFENDKKINSFSGRSKHTFKNTETGNQKFVRDIYDMSKASFKSLLRNLKKTEMGGHKTCISQYKKMAITPYVCPYAYAYINWRKQIEGLNNIWDVENGINNKRHNYQFLSKPDNNYLVDIYNYLLNKTEWQISEIQVRNVCIRIMLTLAIVRFEEWLIIAKYYDISNTNIHNPSIYDSKSFMFIIKKIELYLNKDGLRFFSLTNRSLRNLPIMNTTCKR